MLRELAQEATRALRDVLGKHIVPYTGPFQVNDHISVATYRHKKNIMLSLVSSATEEGSSRAALFSDNTSIDEENLECITVWGDIPVAFSPFSKMNAARDPNQRDRFFQRLFNENNQLYADTSTFRIPNLGPYLYNNRDMVKKIVSTIPHIQGIIPMIQYGISNPEYLIICTNNIETAQWSVESLQASIANLCPPVKQHLQPPDPLNPIVPSFPASSPPSATSLSLQFQAKIGSRSSINRRYKTKSTQWIMVANGRGGRAAAYVGPWDGPRGAAFRVLSVSNSVYKGYPSEHEAFSALSRYYPNVIDHMSLKNFQKTIPQDETNLTNPIIPIHNGDNTKAYTLEFEDDDSIQNARPISTFPPIHTHEPHHNPTPNPLPPPKITTHKRARNTHNHPPNQSTTEPPSDSIHPTSTEMGQPPPQLNKEVNPTRHKQQSSLIDSYRNFNPNNIPTIPSLQATYPEFATIEDITQDLQDQFNVDIYNDIQEITLHSIDHRSLSARIIFYETQDAIKVFKAMFSAHPNEGIPYNPQSLRDASLYSKIIGSTGLMRSSKAKHLFCPVLDCSHHNAGKQIFFDKKEKYNHILKYHKQALIHGDIEELEANNIFLCHICEDFISYKEIILDEHLIDCSQRHQSCHPTSLLTDEGSEMEIDEYAEEHCILPSQEDYPPLSQDVSMEMRTTLLNWCPPQKVAALDHLIDSGISYPNLLQKVQAWRQRNSSTPSTSPYPSITKHP